MSIYRVESLELITTLAEKLKEFSDIIYPPQGSEFWKTASYKELAPADSENFWYVRCASLLRKVKKYGPIGINKLRKHYSGRSNNRQGMRHSIRGSGKIIRVALQQLEAAKLIATVEKEGRVVSPEGISLLERTAYSIIRNKKT